MYFARLRFLISAGICAAVLTACGGSDNSTPPPPPPPVSEVPNEVVRADVRASTGGTLTVPAGAKAMAGAKVEIPADAALEDISVQIGYEDGAPAPFRPEAVAAGALQVSKTIVLTVANGAANTFNDLVTVTVPYDTGAAAGLPPAVLYYDTEAQRYRPTAVIKVDRTAATVTFRTSHFSKFVAVVATSLKSGPSSYRTGFALGTDSILHQNFGSYQFGGHCAAFASLSSHYYTLGKSKPLHQLAQEGLASQPFDDELTRTALTLTYALIAKKWASHAGSIVIPSAADTGMLMLQNMVLTGAPVHLVMHSNTNAGGHSVTVYGYDAATRQFLVYDSNFPAEAVNFPWNPTDGFGAYSKRALYPSSMFDYIGFATDDTFGAPAQFQKIVADWESGKLKDFFANLEVTDQKSVPQKLLYEKAVTVQIPFDDNQSVSGRFSAPAVAGLTPYLHVFIDGVQQTAAASPIDASGNFKVVFPKKLENKKEVVLIVSGHPRSIGVQFSAFGRFSVESAGKGFFINFGFETGDLTGWTANTTLRYNGAPFTPTKAEVVGIGFDPIATDLPTAVFGSKGAKINDATPDYHSSLVSQRATVPLTGNPQMRFQWAAVLEDPQHSPQDQPYVEVIVRNITKGITLYQKRFYTNDPTAPGWRDYQGGKWKAIPWQSVVLGGMAQYAGDEVELSMRGVDCNLGAHGGYVYLDGEE